MATPYTENERQQLVSIFESLDVKPKMDNADDLKTGWQIMSKVKVEWPIQVINWPQVQYPRCQ